MLGGITHKKQQNTHICFINIYQGLWLSATAIGNLFIFLGVKMLNAFPQQWMTWGVFALSVQFRFY